MWTEHLRYRIELRDKMSGFLARALRFLRKRALAVGDKPSQSNRDLGLAQSKVSGALAAGWLCRFATHYRARLNVRAAFRMMLPVALRNFFHDYIWARDTETAHATLDLSPPGRRSTTCPRLLPEPSPGASSAAQNAPPRSRKAAAHGDGAERDRGSAMQCTVCTCAFT